jgi:hypothetical protein
MRYIIERASRGRRILTAPDAASYIRNHKSSVILPWLKELEQYGYLRVRHIGQGRQEWQFIFVQGDLEYLATGCEERSVLFAPRVRKMIVAALRNER